MPITLNANEVYASLSNMIISQTVWADNIKRPGKLIDRFRKEGAMYGDTKYFYSIDSLGVHIWPDSTRKSTSNLLSKDYPQDPHVESIKIDQFRQIRLTTEALLSRRAWMSEGVFGDFQSVLINMMTEAKQAYEDTLFDAFVGTVEGITTNAPTVALLSGATDAVDIEAQHRVNAARISETIENLIDDLKEYSKGYNSLGYLRSYAPSDFVIIFNNKYKNLVKYGALPTLFNAMGIETKFDHEALNHKFFGTISALTTSAAGARKLQPGWLTVGGVATYFRAGDVVPTGTTVPANSTYINTVFQAKDDVICKLVHKDAVEYDSAFTTQTEFWNARDLDTNHYVTFGHNTLKALQSKPIIAIKVA